MAEQRERRQLALDWPSQPSYLASDFTIGACNHAAHELLIRWPDWPHFAASLHGPAGAGKTHLAHIWADTSGAAFGDPGALLEAGPERLIEQGRRWVLELDAAGPGVEPAHESVLFHFHNLVRQTEGSLLYVSRQPLARLPVQLPDLRSRFAACPSVGVSAPDDAVLTVLMHKLAADRQIALGKEVVAYLLPRVERSFAAIAELIHAIDVHALARRRQITPALAGEVLKALAQERNDKGEDE